MIITHFDHNYVEWGQMLLLSVSKHCKNETVYISAANLNEAQLSGLRKCYDNVIIENHIFSPPKELKWRRFMQCRISKVILDSWIHSKKDLCIAMDSDMLFVKPIDVILEESRGYQISLFFDEKHTSLNPPQILNGFIVFDPTSPLVYDFFLEYDKLWSKKIPEYMDDQRQLYVAYKRYHKVLNFGRINEKYVDGTFGDDSYVWSAHIGDRFFNYKRFRIKLGLSDTNVCPNNGWRFGSDVCDEEFIRRNKGDCLNEG